MQLLFPFRRFSLCCCLLLCRFIYCYLFLELSFAFYVVVSIRCRLLLLYYSCLMLCRHLLSFFFFHFLSCSCHRCFLFMNVNFKVSFNFYHRLICGWWLDVVLFFSFLPPHSFSSFYIFLLCIVSFYYVDVVFILPSFIALSSIRLPSVLLL